MTKGEILQHDSSAPLTIRFQESTAVFNGAVKTFAFALVRPLNAADVSTYVLHVLLNMKN